MQIDKSQYDPEQHEVFKCLCVKQPYADLLTNVVMMDEMGGYHADKTIEVRSRNTNFRGDLLICASANPVLENHMSGVTCGYVELYDVKRVEDFTPEDWAATCIPEDKRPAKGYGWMMRNPRRVVEMPVKGKLGIYDLIVPKGDITEYPKVCKMGADGWKIVQKKMNENGRN